MKHAKKSKSIFKAIIERFSYKPKSMLTAISLFVAAGILTYLNSGSSALLAAPSLEIVTNNHSSIKFLAEILIGAASFIALTSIEQKK